MSKPFSLLCTCLCFILVTACESSPPTSMPPFAQVTATPGSSPSSFKDKTETDIQERQIFNTLDYTHMNPAQTRVLYTYHQQRKLTFKDYSSVYQSQASGLWVYDRTQQKHTEIFPAKEDYSGIRYHEVLWVNNQEMVYLDADRHTLMALDVNTQEKRPLLEKNFILSFKVQAGFLFALSLEDKKATMTRLDLNSPAQQQLVREIPYTDFYNSQEFDVLTPDLILLGQFKDFYKNNDYPFKVATTSPPPLQDSFLFNLSTHALTPLEQGLDLQSYEKIEISPDQAYFATARGSTTQIYKRSGELLLEKKGSFYWLDNTQLLLQHGRDISRVVLQGDQASLAESFSTQTACTQIQGPQPIVMECQVYEGIYEQKKQARVFSLFPTQELPFDEENTPKETFSRRLASPQKGQPVRILEASLSSTGYARLSTLSPTGELQTVFQLNFPKNPKFTFDPNAYWSTDY